MQTKKTLFYAGQPGSGFGWGVCNTYLIRELSSLCEVLTSRAAAGLNRPPSGFQNCPVFMPIADHNLEPCNKVRGTINLGYCFFEYPLGPKARENAKYYSHIFCGSTWCKERLAEIGVTHTEVLIQGVDSEIFKPMPELRGEDDEIRIFSGGKFEYRKGQDLVLAAFKLLHEKYPKLRLVTLWHNPWPGLYETMRQSPWIKMPEKISTDWPILLREILQVNEIPKEKVLIIPPCDSAGMAFCMNQTDFGVFPNRCEGGTNLVMMEYAACGKIVLATNGTGHADVIYDIGALYPKSETTEFHWEETNPVHIAESLEDMIQLRCQNFKTQKPYRRPWSEPAQQILAAIERLTCKR